MLNQSTIALFLLVASAAVQSITAQLSTNVEHLPDSNANNGIDNIAATASDVTDTESSVIESEPKQLDTSDPMLWHMAAFAARQMSSKTLKFKLSTLDSAEQTDSNLYRFRVTLQRSNNENKNDEYYCTVEVKTNSEGQQWSVDNYGCTIPAVIRRRRPAKPTSAPVNQLDNKLQSLFSESGPRRQYSQNQQSIIDNSIQIDHDQSLLRMDRNRMLAKRHFVDSYAHQSAQQQQPQFLYRYPIAIAAYQQPRFYRQYNYQ